WLRRHQPRNARRRLFDGCALAIALVAFIASLHWAMGHADRHYGALWPQILATSVGYGVFLAVLLAAIAVRGSSLRRGEGWPRSFFDRLRTNGADAPARKRHIRSW